MSKLFPPPLYSFLLILARHGGVHPSKLTHLAPWLVKMILFEPLRLAELALYQKKIQATTPHPHPLFILGHYRSGTTYLQRLLMQDPRFGYQSIFHSGLPEIMLGFEGLLKPLLEGATKLLGAENKFHQVPFGWDFPGEEDVALTAFGFEDAAHWGNLFPDQLADYFKRYVFLETSAREAEAWKSNYCYFLKKLSLKHNNKPLLLKSPPNTARIPVLLELFPEARFVHIYRNPYDVFASSKRFWQIINQYYALQPLSQEGMYALILSTYTNMMERYLQTRHQIPQGQLLEIRYEALAQNPLQKLEELYSYLQLGNFKEVKEKAAAFVQASRSYRHSHYQLSEKEKAMVDQHWDKFLPLWGSAASTVI